MGTITVVATALLLTSEHPLSVTLYFFNHCYEFLQ